MSDAHRELECRELERLGQHVAAEQDALRAHPAHAAQRTQARERFLALESAPRSRPLRVTHAVLGSAALAAAAALVLWTRAPEPPAALELHIGVSKEPVRVGAWVEAPATGGDLRLRFSDGARIDIAPRSRMRVIELNSNGAHLLLESGQAHVSVVPRQNTSWRLSVGPFAVRVVGTEFDVGWDPEQDVFGLDLAHGKVELSGCVFGSQYRLRAGQTIDASCKAGRFHVADRADRAQAHATAPSKPSAPAPAPLATPETPTPETRALEARVPETRVPGARKAAKVEPRVASGWRALAERGKYAEAFAVTRDGEFEAELSRASADELALLAETARHVGEASREADALLSIRRRFAGTARAALAAFALGRLELDKRHAHEEAARWFATYLKEQPRGSLVREARGRLIEATLAAGDRSRARELAADYLQDYPSGPHAALARGLMESSDR